MVSTFANPGLNKILLQNEITVFHKLIESAAFKQGSNHEFLLRVKKVVQRKNPENAINFCWLIMLFDLLSAIRELYKVIANII